MIGSSESNDNVLDRAMRAFLRVSDSQGPSSDLVESIVNSVADSSDSGVDFSKFPVVAMANRGWFDRYASSGWSRQRKLREYVLGAPFRGRIASLFRRGISLRSKKQVDKFSLAAWSARVARVGDELPLKGTFKVSHINDGFLAEIAQLSTSPDGPQLAKEKLSEAGIGLVIEPQLPKCGLDGAAMIVNSRPIVGMTIRYDRIDSFWYTLMHELGHVVLHLDDSDQQFFDDMDARDELASFEREADAFASETLVPKAAWETSAARLLPSKEAALLLANDLHIHPAIVAGRIRYERKKYTFVNDLVGQGGVRKQFPGIKWS